MDTGIHKPVNTKSKYKLTTNLAQWYLLPSKNTTYNINNLSKHYI